MRRSGQEPHPLYIHIGQRLRARRMQLRLSQADLAERVGLNFRQVQKYERGINRISASALYELARALGVAVDYFYADLPNPAAALSMTHQFAPTSDGVELADIAIALPLTSRRGLVSIVRDVARIANEASNDR
jgi:transcriptional regulator with XRE-family HTH domain